MDHRAGGFAPMSVIDVVQATSRKQTERPSLGWLDWHESG
jgi:hypothetical protein